MCTINILGIILSDRMCGYLDGLHFKAINHPVDNLGLFFDNLEKNTIRRLETLLKKSTFVLDAHKATLLKGVGRWTIASTSSTKKRLSLTKQRASFIE